MNRSIQRFLREEDGVTALEYGLLAALVAGALVLIAGPQLRDFFTALFTQLQAALTGAGSGGTGGTGGGGGMI